MNRAHLASVPLTKPRQIATFASGDLRRKISTLDNSIRDAAKLAAAALALTDGAIDLCRSSGTSTEMPVAVRDWVKSHIQEIRQAHANGETDYRKIDDLREAANDAISEVESVVKASGVSAIGYAICDRVERILNQHEKKELTVAAATESTPAPTTVGWHNLVPPPPPQIIVMRGDDTSSQTDFKWIAGISAGLLLTVGVLLGMLFGRKSK